MPVKKRTLIKQCLLQLLGQDPQKKMIKQWEKLYGPFDHNSYSQHTLLNLPSESCYYHGEIISWVRKLTPKPQRTLLAGEGRQAAVELAKVMPLGDSCTAGVLDVDYPWNFEEKPPEIGRFDLIISQAILEHLINPYQHILDLSNLLNTNGYLLLHTVTPGFVYHRYPIDTCRFFPDFFETFAEKRDLRIRRKRVHDCHIFYLFQQNE